jgi:hypothetical protein
VISDALRREMLAPLSREVEIALYWTRTVRQPWYRRLWARLRGITLADELRVEEVSMPGYAPKVLRVESPLTWPVEQDWPFPVTHFVVRRRADGVPLLRGDVVPPRVVSGRGNEVRLDDVEFSLS